VAGLWEGRRGEMLEGTVGSTRLGEEMKEVLEFAKGKQDVITLAKTLRGGLARTEIIPLNNGFMVSIRPHDPNLQSQNFVFTRPDKIGTLVHTLYNSDLDNPKAIKRLRRLMGYL
jgi:hypothetical protein